MTAKPDERQTGANSRMPNGYRFRKKYQDTHFISLYRIHSLVAASPVAPDRRMVADLAERPNAQ